MTRSPIELSWTAKKWLISRVVAIAGGEGEVAGIAGGYAFNAPCGANKQKVKTIVYPHVRMVRSLCVGPHLVPSEPVPKSYEESKSPTGASCVCSDHYRFEQFAHSSLFTVHCSL